MARIPNNIVSKKVLDVGDPDALKKAADRIGRQVVELRQHLGTAVPRLVGIVNTRAMKPMLEKLRIYPPRWLGMKMRWKSRKQMIFVIMKLRAENDLPYKRKFNLRKGWVATVELNPKTGGIKVTVENTATAPDSKGRMVKIQPFVTGNIGLGTSRQSMQRYDQPMQPFHKDRGWQPSAPIIQRYFLLANDIAEEYLGKIVDRIIRKQ